ncbi:MAG: cation:proton antiporter [Chloroflexi bacterium]|nr:cation:proton antiporter [Chloroflexota bacterium]
MSSTLQLLLVLSIFIFAAKAGGLISTRFRQPAVLGQLTAGLILGPTGLALLQQPLFSAEMSAVVLDLGELGVIFLMFIAGLEVDLEQMLKSGRVAVLTGIMGVIAPLLLGTLTALAFQVPLLGSIFVGLILTATSVSISAQTLLEMGVLQSKEGLALLGAAVVDDVLGILLLSIFIALAHGGEAGAGDVLMVLLRIALYFAVTIAFGIALLPRLTHWVDRLPISEGVMAWVVIVTLLFAWSAEVVGEVAAITGAFVAGAMFGRTALRHVIAEGMHTLTYAFFVPVFLISVGLRADARVLGSEGLLFAGMIIAVAVVAKIIGCGLGALAGGFTPPQALRVGVGMISRGEVGLIIASIGLTQAWIEPDVYATMILMVLATTLVTPVLLRQVFPRLEVAPARTIPSAESDDKEAVLTR